MTSDPAEAFPPEIFLKIVAKLEPHAVWGLRRVSKKYNRVLSDESVVVGALARNELQDLTDCARNTPGSIEERVNLLKAHHTGIPAGIVELPELLYERLVDLWCPEIVLKGRFLAVTTDVPSLVVADLCDGATFEYHEQSSISSPVITSTVLAYIIEDEVACCPLAELKPEGGNATRLCKASEVTGQGHVLIALVETDKVAVIDTTNNNITTIDLQPSSKQHSWGNICLRMAHQECLMVRSGITSDWMFPSRSIADVTRLSFSPDMQHHFQSRGEFPVPYRPDATRKHIVVQITDSPGQWYIALGQTPTKSDALQGFLCERWRSLPDKIIAHAFWRGKAYGLFQQEDEYVIAIQHELAKEPHAYIASWPAHHRPTIAINESFLVSLAQTIETVALRVYCFDPGCTKLRVSPFVDLDIEPEHERTYSLRMEP